MNLAMLEFGWTDFREDNQINPALGFSAEFPPSGAHGGPRGAARTDLARTIVKVTLEMRLETNAQARSWVLCVFGVGCKKVQTTRQS